MTGQVQLEYLRSLDDLDIGEWRDLALRSRNVFAAPEWLLTWWSHYGKGQSQLIGAARNGGELVAIMPLYEWWGRGVPLLRFIGHGPSDQLGPICSVPQGAEATAAVEELLDAIPIQQFVLLAETIGSDQSLGESSGARRLFRDSSPVLHVPSTWDEFMAERSGNFRAQVRRSPRRLAKLGALSYRVASSSDEFERDLNTLFTLHEKRWGKQTSFMQAAAFHREFAIQAFTRGWSRLWILELDGRPIAAELGFRFAGSECFYQSGRDPSFRDVSLGLMVLVHAIREAVGEGIQEFRLLRGGEPYKLRLATSDPGVETYGYSRGSVARFLLASAVAARGRSLGFRHVLDRL
jgi:CelD/BcsL family acetyltransferase involved in cellulose biosynthesis